MCRRRLQSADARPPSRDDHRRSIGVGCVHRRGSGDGGRRGAGCRTGRRVRVDEYDGIRGRARFRRSRYGEDRREHGERSSAGAHVRAGAHVDICCRAIGIGFAECVVVGNRGVAYFGAHVCTHIDPGPDRDPACANRGGRVDHTRLDLHGRARHTIDIHPTDISEITSLGTGHARETARAGRRRSGCPLGHEVSDLPGRQRLARRHFEASARQTGCRVAHVDGCCEPYAAP